MRACVCTFSFRILPTKALSPRYDSPPLPYRSYKNITARALATGRVPDPAPPTLEGLGPRFTSVQNLRKIQAVQMCFFFWLRLPFYLAPPSVLKGFPLYVFFFSVPAPSLAGPRGGVGVR